MMADCSTHASWTPEGEAKPMPTEDALVAAIATVYDPEIPVNIYEMGLIYAIEINDRQIKIEMTLTTPNCPSAQELPEEVRQAVLKVAGVDGVEIALVWEPAWDPSRMSEDARLMLNMM